MSLIIDGLSIEEKELQESFVRSPGPGGQNVNKLASAVQLRFEISASSLPQGVKDRLAELAAGRIDSRGTLHIHAHRHRTRERNREDARQRLVDLVARAATPRRKRRPTRPGTAARERRLRNKRQRSRTKDLRSSVREHGD